MKKRRKRRKKSECDIMGKRSATNSYYKDVDGKIERTRKNCPKCGPGVFLAEHPNRTACGKCGYTEFKKK